MTFRVAGGTGSGGTPVFVGGKYGAFHYDYTTTLSGELTQQATTIPVTSTTGFSTAGAIVIDYEVVSYTGITSNSFTGCTRGAYGTAATSHSSGAYVGGAQGASANTVTLLQINTTDLSAGVSLTASSEMQVDATGIYSVTFSVQCANAGNAPDNFTVWARQNGTDIPSSASISTTPSVHGGIPGASIVCINLFLSLMANDKVQLYWATDSGNTVVVTYPASTSPAHPASPAVIATVQQVS